MLASQPSAGLQAEASSNALVEGSSSEWLVNKLADPMRPSLAPSPPKLGPLLAIGVDGGATRRRFAGGVSGELLVSDELISNGITKARFIVGVVWFVGSFVTGSGTPSATVFIASTAVALRPDKVRLVAGRSNDGSGSEIPRVLLRSPDIARGVDLKFDTGLIVP